MDQRKLRERGWGWRVNKQASTRPRPLAAGTDGVTSQLLHQNRDERKYTVPGFFTEPDLFFGAVRFATTRPFIYFPYFIRRRRYHFFGSRRRRCAFADAHYVPRQQPINNQYDRWSAKATSSATSIGNRRKTLNSIQFGTVNEKNGNEMKTDRILMVYPFWDQIQADVSMKGQEKT